MIPLAIVAVALASVVLTLGAAGVWLWRHASAAEAARYEAEDQAHAAKTQEAYAKIATDGRSVDDTAGVLDDGRFFLPADQGVHPSGTEAGRHGDQVG